MGFHERCVKAFTDAGIAINEKQIDQLATYKELLLQWNSKMNLTAITEEQEMIRKHFLDAALLSPLIEKFSLKHTAEATLLDVGTGAGFPGLVLATMMPNLRVSCLDGLQKRIKFLQTVVNELSLSNVVALYHGRAEDFANQPNHREKYDFVTARAVASLPQLLELTVPFVKIDGAFIAMKGPDAETELVKAAKAMVELEVVLVHRETFMTSVGEKRQILVFRKKASTKEIYPRKPKAIKNKPL